MKIQTQNILAIIPIFLLLGIISSGLLFIAERQEILWGLKEEASSLAVSISEFLNGEKFEKKSSNKFLFQSNLKEIIDANQAKRIKLYSYDFGKIKPYFVIGDETFDHELPSPIAIKSLIKNELLISNIIHISVDISIICAYAPIYLNEKNVSGILEVIIDASEMRQRTNTILLNSVKITCGILFFGLFIVFIVSKQITKRINLLNVAASKVASGNYESKISGTGTINIQEVSDLSNTFNTMSSVLSDFSSQSKQELIEAEQFRSSNDIAKNFLETYYPVIDISQGGIQTMICRVSNIPNGDFFDAFSLDSNYYVIIGKTKNDEINKSNDLYEITHASAVLSFIKQKINKKDPEDLINQTIKFFEMEICHILKWKDDSQTIQRWQFINNSISEYSTDSNALDPIIITTVNEELEQKIISYAKKFKNISDSELVKELLLLVEKDDNGLLCIIREEDNNDNGIKDGIC